MGKAATETVALSRVRTAFFASTVASYISFLISQVAVLWLVSAQSKLSPSLYFRYGNQPLISFLKPLAVWGIEVAIFAGICLAIPVASYSRKTKIIGIIVAGVLMIGGWGTLGLIRFITEFSVGTVTIFFFQLTIALICLSIFVWWWEGKLLTLGTDTPASTSQPVIASKSQILFAAYLCAYIGLTVGGLIDMIYRLVRLANYAPVVRDMVIRQEWSNALYSKPILALALLWILPARNIALLRWAFIGSVSAYLLKILYGMSVSGWNLEAFAVSLGCYAFSIWLAMFLYVWLNPEVRIVGWIEVWRVKRHEAQIRKAQEWMKDIE